LALTRDSAWLRRLAYLGAAHGPKWLLRYSPPVVGLAVAAFSRDARSAVQRNLTRVRGEGPAWRDALDTAQTFTSFAGALAESLAAGSKNEAPLEPLVVGREHMLRELGGPMIVGTIHSGGWDVLGSVLAGELSLDVLVVMAPERDERARVLHDAARARVGVRVLHVGMDALDALPLVRHLRAKGVVAVQLDRTPPGMRALPVRLFEAEGTIPAGPFELARLTGAPIVNVFCARLGFRRYLVEIHPAIRLAKTASPEDVARAAQGVADRITSFLREHPSQWFNF
jgi:phosphatidylinositol dimannoside acyltransferase